MKALAGRHHRHMSGIQYIPYQYESQAFLTYVFLTARRYKPCRNLLIIFFPVPHLGLLGNCRLSHPEASLLMKYHYISPESQAKMCHEYWSEPVCRAGWHGELRRTPFDYQVWQHKYVLFSWNSAFASLMRRPAIAGESPSVKPNCISDWAIWSFSSKAYSNTFPNMAVTVIPL